MSIHDGPVSATAAKDVELVEEALMQGVCEMTANQLVELSRRCMVVARAGTVEQAAWALKVAEFAIEVLADRLDVGVEVTLADDENAYCAGCGCGF